MRIVSGIGRPCERAREYASLRLDGELSEFESVLLESHLERCGSCMAFATDLGVVTEHLRAAPLERLESPIALPSRRRVSMRGVQVAAAAALVVSVVGLGSLLGSFGPSGPSPSQAAATLVAHEDRNFRDLRRASLLDVTFSTRATRGTLGILTV